MEPYSQSSESPKPGQPLNSSEVKIDDPSSVMGPSVSAPGNSLELKGPDLKSETFGSSEFSARILSRGVPIEGLAVKAGPVTLCMLPDLPVQKDIQRIIELEQNAWLKNTGIHVSASEIFERLLGNSQSSRTPNPIIVAREGGEQGRIVGAIWMSFCDTGGDIKRIPDKYSSMASSHSPEGDTIVDFSVFTDQQDKVVAGYRLLPKLARASLALAQILGKQHLVAYSRAEFFLPHARWGDKFAGYQIGNGQRRDTDAIFKEFSKRFPEPNFKDYIEFFGTEISNESLEAFRADRARLMSQLSNINIKLPSDEILREYFDLSAWNAPSLRRNASLAGDKFVDFARFHLNDVGDPFLMRAHQNLGAKIASVIVLSRPEDLRGAGANVMMRYPVPEASSPVRDLGGNWLDRDSD